MQTSRQQKTLCIIAANEAVKGVLALLAMVGLLSLLHHDLHHLAVSMIGRFGLDTSTHWSSFAVLASNAWMVGYLIVQLRQRQRTGFKLGAKFQ
jgi:Predicted membrane protein (DUF2127)